MEKRLVRVAGAILDIDPRHKVEYSLNADGLIRLDSNENTLGPSPKVREALENVITSRALNFRAYAEPDTLLERLSCYTGVGVDSISCFATKESALEHIGRTFLEPGVEAVINDPESDDFARVAQSLGARVIELHHDNPFEFNIEALINQIGPKTRVIYISNPDGNSGASFSESEIVFLLAYAERIMVIVDEEYFEFCGCSVADLTSRFPNLIVMRTLSRAFGLSALGFSYILTDPENLGFIDRVKLNSGPDLFSTAAAIAALEDLSHIRRYAFLIDESKKLLLQNLPEIGYQFRMTDNNFFLLKVSDSHQALKLLNECGIAACDLSDNQRFDGLLRITIGTPEQTDSLLTALGRMAEKTATGFNRNRAEAVINRLKVNINELVAAR